MNEIRFVDTTLRDGQLSLWASNMRTGMMLPIAERLDRAGFEAIEIMASAFYKKCVRDLKEDPWERLRLMSKRIKRTPLRTIRSRSMLAFQISPPSVTELWLERLAANGITEIRTSDPSNTPSNWAEAVRAARRDRLVPLILREAGNKPVEFHTHCNTGLGALCCLEAVKLGIASINTAIPPLADASSNPSLFNVAMNARALGFQTAVDEEVVKPVRDHFAAIARQEHLPVGKPLEYDAFHPMHQVPGGMISNFRFQLANIGKLDRLNAVLEEAARVRAELGYPIMVTPYSQFVGVQAAINVIVGERYKEVTDEMFLYALGFWGEEEAQSIEPNLRDRLLGRPRAKELARLKAPETSLKEFKEKYGGAGVADDEAMLRYFAGAESVAAMDAAGRGRDFTSTKMPLLALIETLAGRKESRQIFIRKGNLTVRLEQRQRDGGSAKRTNPRQLLSTSPQ